MGDAPVRRHHQQPLRKVVVEGKRGFQTAHCLDLALPVARHVGDLPQGGPLCGLALSRPGTRPHADAQPLAAGSSAHAGVNVELLVPELPALGRPVQPKERLRRAGLAGQQLFQRGGPGGTAAGETLHGGVAVEHGAVPIDKLHPAVHALGNRFRALAFGRALVQAQQPGQKPENEEHAADREHRQQAERDLLDGAAQLQRDRGNGGDAGKAQHGQRALQSLRAREGKHGGRDRVAI